MLSQRSRYALKALLHLAEIGGSRSISSIATAARVPRKFLEAILGDLRREGLVVSTRGVSGGYALAHPPERISFGAIIRITEGPLALVPCASVNFYRPCADCPDEAACTLRRVMAQARAGVAAVLDETTLASAIAERQAAVEALTADASDRAGLARPVASLVEPGAV